MHHHPQLTASGASKLALLLDRIASALRNALFLALVAGALAGCTRYPPELYGFDFDNAYALDSGDEIRVVIFEVDNLPQTYKVDASGHISIPMAGVIPVRGRTVEQVERAVASRVKDRFVKEPKVAVQVAIYRPFYVLGEVKNAGQYSFAAGMTVESAVAVAGGYTERAYLSEARVVRQGPDGARIVSYVPGGYPVRPGDTIYVPERWF
jgi:polysaccharide export outer membrane protein